MKHLATVIKAAVLCAALFAGTCAQAALFTFTSRAAFDAATTLQSIEQNIAPPGSYYFLGNLNYNGILYPDYAYMVDPDFAPALYQWNSGPVLLLAPLSKLSFEPTTAFAADFGTLPDGFELSVVINGSVTRIPTPKQRQLTFFGWTSDTPFTSVILQSNSTYLILDNVTRGYVQPDVPPPASAPEPTSLALLGAGLAALALRRRRKV